MQGLLSLGKSEAEGDLPRVAYVYGTAIVTFQRVNLGKATYVNAVW